MSVDDENRRSSYGTAGGYDEEGSEEFGGTAAGQQAAFTMNNLFGGR